MIPDPPKFTVEEMQHCKETGNYTPILFEWYKFVASLGTFVTHIMPDSPAFKEIPEINYHVSAGLLNRCWRLMLSNVALSHKGKFGETTAIIDRCIFESAVKLQWLCLNPTPEKFRRFLADGLKTELELKAWIDNEVALNGSSQRIETRMRNSINNHIAASGLSESEIADSPKMPDMASMLTAIGHNRLSYIVAQKIGSHHVHGTWPSLLFHYLEEKDAPEGRPDLTKFQPRGHDCEMHINQYMYTPVLLLDTLSVYVGYALQHDEAEVFKKLFADTKEEVLGAYFASEQD
jgi:hypothetical protein